MMLLWLVKITLHNYTSHYSSIYFKLPYQHVLAGNQTQQFDDAAYSLYHSLVEINLTLKEYCLLLLIGEICLPPPYNFTAAQP